jgi:hypothetical protein
MESVDPSLYQVPGTSADASSKKDKELSSPKQIVKREDIQAGMANAFSEIDKDGDGKLRLEEFMAACKVHYHKFTVM